MGEATSTVLLLTRVLTVPLPLCPDQQIKGLNTQVIRTLWVEQNAVQQVEEDISGGIVTRL